MATVTGGNGSDILVFQGTIGQYTATLVNPYSGASIFVDEQKNINNATYNGLLGTDTLLMSNIGDVLFLDSGSNTANIQNTERIIAGAGGDIIVMADDVLTLGNIYIDGGAEGDIIWSNVGNDTINGFDGNDIIDGGPGNDVISGGNDNDVVNGGAGADSLSGDNGVDILWGDAGDDGMNGGAGNDTLYGGFGNDVMNGGADDDTLYGGNGAFDNPGDYTHTITYSHVFVGAAYPQPLDRHPHTPVPAENSGVQPGNLDVAYQTTAHITYVASEAGFRNGVGVYTVGEDGTIRDVEILFKNQKALADGETFTYEFSGQAGDSIGFFLTANGYSMSLPFRNADLSQGTLQFIYDFNGPNQRAANINDDGNLVSLVFDNGVSMTAYNMNIYHSSLSGGIPSLNKDGMVHAISGLADANDPSALRIGFEDIYKNGDSDFDDVIFDLSLETREILVPGAQTDNDRLNGGAGNDTLYGGFGDDLLIAGQGADRLYGGDGSDTFAFNLIDGMLDRIYDFDVGAGKDVLNLTDILSGYDPMADAMSDFVRMVHSGTDDIVEVSAAGDGVFQQLVAFDGGLGGATLAGMLASGNLVLDQSAIV